MIILAVFGLLDSFKRGRRKKLEDYKRELDECHEYEAKVLIEMGIVYLEKGEIEKAREKFAEALENYKKAGDVEGEGYAHELIGDCYFSGRNTEAAFEEYESALKCYKKVKSSFERDFMEKMKEVKMIKEAIQESSETKDKKETVKRIQEVPVQGGERPAKVSKETIIKKIDHLILEIIGLVDKYNSYRDLSIKYLENALKSSKLIGDWESGGILHLILGEILFRKGEYEQALEHFKEAYNIFKGKDKMGKGISLLLVGVTSCILKREANIYKIFNDAMTILSETSDKARRTAYDIIETLETL
ncbi:MAG: tetratricopeptide repeat protein [Methanothermobacter sp.]|nr:tetratricopeptide repeat protein [Methanothermobacter sp.]